jgi:hypothetical protein
MALQPAGSDKMDRVFPLNAFGVLRAALVLTALLVLTVNTLHAQSRRLLDDVVGRKSTYSFFQSQTGLILSANLPSGRVGVPYSGSFTASGGLSPYTYRVVDGALPAGLALNGSTGAVTGTPTAAVSKYFWVNASDSRGASTKLHAHMIISASTGTTISVTVSPTSATVISAKTQQFTASVLGIWNSAVTWSATAGSISSGGLFTAPSVSSNTNVTVTATCAADVTKHASASVTVTPAAPAITVAVSPTSISVGSGATQQFTAAVQGTTNTAVTWSASAGSVSSSGLFTAPSVSSNTSVTVTATSAADSTKKASAAVTVSTGVTVAVSPTSVSLTSGNTQQFAAAVQGTSNTSVTWSATAGTISSGGMFTAPSVSSSSSVTITATSAADTTKKSSASVNVSPAQSALGITTSSIPGAQSGTGYSYTLAASGGSTPYQWKISSGSLPQGFTLSSTGQLSGTTTQTGTFSFTTQVTDAGSSTSSKSFSLPVSAPSTTTGGTFDGPAALPRVYMQTSLANTPAPGTTTLVSAGGNLQTALNNANCGDTIQLAAGATFAGVFTVPAKACDNAHWIIVRTSAPDSSLPPEGTRISPCYAGVASLPGRPSYNCSSPKSAMAKVVDSQANNSGPLLLASGANHYRFIGLEITRTTLPGINFQLIYTNGTADHIIVDRSWLHGSTKDDNKGGLSLAGITSGALIDSYATDFHCESIAGTCTDAKVIGGGTGSIPGGPYKIVNNFLEAAGEAILFGGGAGTTTPADIEIRHNHFFKPMTWKSGQSGFVGGAISGYPFIVKNHLELKNAQRVLIEGNIFENVWGGYSQNGYAILLTPKNQASGTTNVCQICQVTDVTIRYNTISHAGAGISMANVLSDNGGWATAGERYSIHDVTIDDIQTGFYVGSGTLFQVMSGWPNNALNNISINHVTGFSDPGSRFLSLGNATTNPPMYAYTMKNSILGQALYPIWSTGGTTNCAYYNVPLTSLTACFVSYNFNDNAIIGTSTTNYPPSKWPVGNYFPSNSGAVQFVNFNNGNGGDYHLLSGSPYKNAASDGKDIGADINAIQSATAGAY